MGMTLEISRSQTAGRLQVSGDNYPLEEFTAIFTRLMDYRFLINAIALVSLARPVWPLWRLYRRCPPPTRHGTDHSPDAEDLAALDRC